MSINIQDGGLTLCATNEIEMAKALTLLMTSLRFSGDKYFEYALDSSLNMSREAYIQNTNFNSASRDILDKVRLAQMIAPRK
jgi:hypothetical protein